MKNSYFRLLSVFLLSGLSGTYAQESTEVIKPSIYQSISITKGQEQITLDKNYYQQQVSSMNELINAIDFKVEYVKGNPEEYAIAMRNGWFENMKTRREEALKLREEYTTKMNATK